MKFEDGDVTEMTAHAIAESMYAMCDRNGNHILLFDAIVDHKKNDKAMTRTEQHDALPICRNRPALYRGGTLARGRVTERKRDHEGNVIGRSNANPILAGGYQR